MQHNDLHFGGTQTAALKSLAPFAGLNDELTMVSNYYINKIMHIVLLKTNYETTKAFQSNKSLCGWFCNIAK